MDRLANYLKTNLILLVVLLLFSHCKNEINTKTIENINQNTPFFWGYKIDSTFINKDLLKDSLTLHPLDLGRYAYFMLNQGKELNDTVLLNKGKKYLDFLINYPYKFEDSTSCAYNYPFTHGNMIAKNWWSGMANSTISLAFLEGFEIFGDSAYYKQFEKSINGIIESISDIGSAVELDDSSKWYLEYADFKSDSTNTKFVLNGFLYALLALDVASEKTDKFYLKEAYNKGVNAYFLLKEKFYYSDSAWTYYMLNPLTIESPHYNIFDLLLLKSLKYSDQNSLFDNEIELRKEILKKAYPVNVKKENGSDIFIFSYIGPPHPYWIDTYQIVIQYFRKGKILKTKILATPRDFNTNIFDRAFNIDTFETKKVDNIKVYSCYFNDTVNLYEVDIDEIEKSGNENHNIFPYKLEIMRDAQVVDNSNIQIINSSQNGSRALNRGTARFMLDENLDIDKNKFFGILINPKQKMSSLLITIIDSLNSATRYYVELMPDTSNMVLLNKLGFKNYESIDCESISEIRFDIFTKSLAKDTTYNIEFSKVFGFENSFQLYNFFKNNEFYFPEEKVPGNIY